MIPKITPMYSLSKVVEIKEFSEDPRKDLEMIYTARG